MYVNLYRNSEKYIYSHMTFLLLVFLQELQDTAADIIGVDKYHQVCGIN